MQRSRNIYFLISFLLSIFSNYNYSAGIVKISYPSAGDTLVAGMPVDISWTNTKNHPVDLFYSNNGGNGWIEIGKNISGSSFRWTVPALDTGDLTLKAVSSGIIDPYLLFEFPGAHSGEVRSVSVSADGNYILSSGKDAKVKLWDIRKRQAVDSLVFTPPQSVYNAVYFHNTDTILLAKDSAAVLWIRTTGQQIILADFQNYVRPLTVHQEKSIFIAGSYDGSIKIYDLNSPNNPVKAIISNDSNEIYSLTSSKDGKYFAFGDYAGNKYLYNWSDYGLLRIIPNSAQSSQNPVWSLRFSHDNDYLLCGEIDPLVKLTRVGDGSIENQFTGHNMAVRSVDWQPGRNIALSASLDYTVRQWIILTGKEICSAINHGNQVLTTCYFPSGDSLVTGGRDFSIKIWKNYEFVSDSDIVTTKIEYPVTVTLPKLKTKAGEMLRIPIIFGNKLKSINSYEPPFNTVVTLNVPARLLDIRSNVNHSNKTQIMDTISFIMNDFVYKDSVIYLSGYMLYDINNHLPIKLLDINFTPRNNYKITVLDGSIELEDLCFNSNIKYSSQPAGLVISPLPSLRSVISVQANLVEDGIHQLDLLNSNGDKTNIIFNKEFKPGIYNYNINLTGMAEGCYWLRLITPSVIVTKPLLNL